MKDLNKNTKYQQIKKRTQKYKEKLTAKEKIQWRERITQRRTKTLDLIETENEDCFTLKAI